jgi:hypothetical protein
MLLVLVQMLVQVLVPVLVLMTGALLLVQARLKSLMVLHKRQNQWWSNCGGALAMKLLLSVHQSHWQWWLRPT